MTSPTKDVKKLVPKETPKAPQKVSQDNDKAKKPTAQDLHQAEKDKNKNDVPAVNPTNAAQNNVVEAPDTITNTPEMPQTSLNGGDGDKPTPAPAPAPEITPPGDTPPPSDNPAENNPKMYV